MRAGRTRSVRALTVCTLALAQLGCGVNVLVPRTIEGPAMVRVPAVLAGVRDGRQRFRQVFCEVLRTHAVVPGSGDDCERRLPRLSDEPAPDPVSAPTVSAAAPESVARSSPAAAHPPRCHRPSASARVPQRVRVPLQPAALPQPGNGVLPSARACGAARARALRRHHRGPSAAHADPGRSRLRRHATPLRLGGPRCPALDRRQPWLRDHGRRRARRVLEHPGCREKRRMDRRDRAASPCTGRRSAISHQGPHCRVAWDTNDLVTFKPVSAKASARRVTAVAIPNRPGYELAPEIRRTSRGFMKRYKTEFKIEVVKSFLAGGARQGSCRLTHAALC